MRLTSTVYGTRKDKGWSKAIGSHLAEKPTHVLYWRLYVRRVLMMDHGDSNTSSVISRINQLEGYTLGGPQYILINIL